MKQSLSSNQNIKFLCIVCLSRQKFVCWFSRNWPLQLYPETTQCQSVHLKTIAYLGVQMQPMCLKTALNSNGLQQTQTDWGGIATEFKWYSKHHLAAGVLNLLSTQFKQATCTLRTYQKVFFVHLVLPAQFCCSHAADFRHTHIHNLCDFLAA